MVTERILKEQIRDILKVNHGIIRFDILLEKIRCPNTKNVPDVIESVINSMYDIQILQYQNMSCTRKLVYVPIETEQKQIKTKNKIQKSIRLSNRK